MKAMRHAGNVYLVGMMGAGKTTVGRLLARRLKLRFIDADQELERRCGVKVPLIFDIEGEAGFRAREAQLLAELTALDGVVLGTCCSMKPAAGWLRAAPWCTCAPRPRTSTSG